MRSNAASYLTGLLVAVLLLTGSDLAAAEALPAALIRQLPPGFAVLRSATASFQHHIFTIVALGKPGENTHPPPENAAARPLLVFERQAGRNYTLAGRNDRVIMRAN